MTYRKEQDPCPRCEAVQAENQAPQTTGMLHEQHDLLENDL